MHILPGVTHTWLNGGRRLRSDEAVNADIVHNIGPFSDASIDTGNAAGNSARQRMICIKIPNGTTVIANGGTARPLQISTTISVDSIGL